jgi:hypothetical protein
MSRWDMALSNGRGIWSDVGVPGALCVTRLTPRGGVPSPSVTGVVVTKERLPVWQEVAPQTRMSEGIERRVVTKW